MAAALQIRTQIEKRFGAQFDRPVAGMTEMIAALRAIFACWITGERLNFRGEYYRHTLMTPNFIPGDNPSGPPPIYVGALGPRLTRATRSTLTACWSCRSAASGSCMR